MVTERSHRARGTSLIAVAMLALVSVSCGSSGSSGQSGTTGSGATEVADRSDDSDGATQPPSTFADNERPASGGPAVDAQWPDEVWIPEDLHVSDVWVHAPGGQHQSQAMGVVEREFDDVKTQITAVNGAPDAEDTSC